MMEAATWAGSLHPHPHHRDPGSSGPGPIPDRHDDQLHGHKSGFLVCPGWSDGVSSVFFRGGVRWGGGGAWMRITKASCGIDRCWAQSIGPGPSLWEKQRELPSPRWLGVVGAANLRTPSMHVIHLHQQLHEPEVTLTNPSRKTCFSIREVSVGASAAPAGGTWNCRRQIWISTRVCSWGFNFLIQLSFPPPIINS